MQDDGHFGARVAATYDDDAEAFDPDAVAATADRLAALAGDGPALEFGIGTGRIALPLAARGIAVHGVDLSEAMLARLRAKPGAEAIGLTVGDIATTRVPGRFAMVYLIFNTITNLTTQAAQVACFRNAAAHLAPGGRFVVEVGVPPLQRLPEGETRLLFRHDPAHWGVDEIDVATQSFTSHHLRQTAGGWEHRAIPFRYVWPSELDLMAEMAGLAPEARWGGWRCEPFTGRCRSHVSIWRRPGP